MASSINSYIRESASVLVLTSGLSCDGVWCELLGVVCSAEFSIEGVYLREVFVRFAKPATIRWIDNDLPSPPRHKSLECNPMGDYLGRVALTCDWTTCRISIENDGSDLYSTCAELSNL
jgi:hypothetical protein